MVTEIALIQTNWFVDNPDNAELEVRYRYRQQLRKAIIKNVNVRDQEATVVFKEVQSGIAPGQSLVIYDGYQMIGGGIIS